MAALITDPELERELIAQRQAWGADKFDEVWDGVYVMSPLANNEHQDLVGQLDTIFTIVVRWAGLGRVQPGANVSDRPENWKQNYRCPDLLVFLHDNPAEDRGTHWFGGPDLAIEVASPGDRSHAKLPFYAEVGTREVLIIDRDPWAFILYRQAHGEMAEVGRCVPDDETEIPSEVVPLRFRLAATSDGIAIHVAHNDGQQSWTIEL